MKRVLELFTVLAKQYTNHVVSVAPELLGTSLSLDLNGRHIMPRIDKEIVINIATAARRGDLRSMGTLSMMYGVGLGVPKDETLCLCWAAMSIMEAPPVSLSSITKSLTAHLDAISGAFAYPAYILDAMKSFTPKYDVIDSLKHVRGHYRISSSVKGIPLNLVYRFTDTDCYLYSATTANGKTILLDRLQRLNIPKIIGVGAKGTPTIADYKARASSLVDGENVKLMVVSGVLAVPNSLRQIAKDLHPQCVKTTDLLVSLMQDERERYRYERMEILPKLEAELEDLRARRKLAKSGELAKKLKRDYSRLKAKPVQSNKVRKAMEAIQHEFKMCKSGEIDHVIKAKIIKLKAEIKRVEAEDAENSKLHKFKYIENLLTFIPDDVFYYTPKGKRHPALGNTFKVHLQSAGFDCSGVSDICLFATPSDKLRVKEIVEILHDEEYTTNSLILRSVNKSDKVNPLKINV